MLLEVGILFHSVFIGMALSVSIGANFVVLLIAIAFHRPFFPCSFSWWFTMADPLLQKPLKVSPLAPASPLLPGRKRPSSPG
jgi:hypothetical protein